MPFPFPFPGMGGAGPAGAAAGGAPFGMPPPGPMSPEDEEMMQKLMASIGGADGKVGISKMECVCASSCAVCPIGMPIHSCDHALHNFTVLCRLMWPRWTRWLSR